MDKFKYDTVFIVDDNSTANLVHQHLLKRISPACPIKTFTNPVNALKEIRRELLVEETRILVLLDIHMPEMNGFEFLDASLILSGKHDTLDVIMVTSSIDASELEQGTKHPLVRKVFSKPLKANQLVDFIAERSPISA